MARNPAPDGARKRFAELLTRHLADGTRPNTAKGEPWTNAGFARDVTSDRSEDGYVSDRTVANWRKAKSLPAEIEPILKSLFGPSNRHGEAREELREAYKAACLEKSAIVVARAKPDPAGGRWVVEEDQFALDRTTRPSDERIAADPLHQQLQAAIRGFAEDLAERAKRLENTRAWGRLAEAAKRFSALVACDPRLMPKQLGTAYPLLLQLGRFRETDDRIDRDSTAFDNPLDHDIQGLLTDLVRTAAPWLRGFPTVAKWDDEAGKALVRAALFEPSRKFVRRALQEKAIAADDAAALEILADTADAQDFQGRKAGARLVGSARNLMVAGGTALAASQIPGLPQPSQTLVDRAVAMLAAAGPEITENLPGDLRLALRALIDNAGKPPARVAPGEARPHSPSIPDDVERQALAMILNERAPPAAWRPHIRTLDFSYSSLESVALLAGLSGLALLDLRGTHVRDVSALAGLSGLQSLYLMNTLVSDVSALAGLSGLQSLDLRDTQVSDVSALAGLSGLQSLDLRGTQVSDVSALAGLSANIILDPPAVSQPAIQSDASIRRPTAKHTSMQRGKKKS